MNYGNICKITHPLTRAAILADQDNPKLRAAFPECFEGESLPIPWSLIVRETKSYEESHEHMFDYEELASLLLSLGVPVTTFRLYNESAGSRKEDVGDPEYNYLFPEKAKDEYHPAFEKKVGQIATIHQEKFVVVNVYGEIWLVVINKNAVDMTK